MRSLANLQWAMHQAARDLKAASKESKSMGAHHELPLLILILDHAQEARWTKAEFLAGKVTEIRVTLEGLLKPEVRHTTMALLLDRITELSEREAVAERTAINLMDDSLPGSTSDASAMTSSSPS